MTLLRSPHLFVVAVQENMTMPPYETLCTMYDETLKRILGKHFAAFLKSDFFVRMKVDSAVHAHASSEQDDKQV